MPQRTHPTMRLKIFLFLLAVLTTGQVFACESKKDFDESGSGIEAKDISVSYDIVQKDRPIVTTLAVLANNTGSCVDNIVVEVRHFNSAGAMINAQTESLYGVIIPSHKEAAINIRTEATKQESEYASTKLRVVSVDERVTNEPKKRHWAIELFFSLLPILLLIGVWLYFIKKSQNKSSPQQKTIQLIEAQNVILERQVAALEKLTTAATALRSGQQSGT